MTPLWSRLRDSIDRDGEVAMVTVIATQGSAPRDAGARLVVHQDGTFFGTIGGGALEWQAIALSQSALAAASTERTKLRSFALGPELGQCCGGRVEFIVELIGEEERLLVDELARRESIGAFATRASVSGEGGVVRKVVDELDVRPGRVIWDQGLLVEGFGSERRPLYLFGAGHVGRALILALAPLPFAVTWIDSRPDSFTARVPPNVVAKHLEDPVDAITEAPAGSFILVMTHSHPLDLALVSAALSESRFPYVGLIGSASKRVQFEKRLIQAGIAKSRIEGFVCPIGVKGIGSKDPAAIAAATVAELLIHNEALQTSGKIDTFDDLQSRRVSFA